MSSVFGDSGQACGSEAPGSVAEALRMAGAGLEYLNSSAADDLDPAALGEVLTALGDLQGRLAAIDRALARLDAGTYGRSVRSGQPIPDERLEADPAAELTVQEAASDRR